MVEKVNGTIFSGQITGVGCRFVLLVSRFNSLITDKLLLGAQQTLLSHATQAKDIDVVYVPGAFELPVVARRLAATKIYDAVVCLGAVIRGATPHFDHVASQAAAGLAKVAIKTQVPVVFGLLTCDTLEQALDRAGGKAGNKGADAALTALEMAQLMRLLPTEVVGR